jgi:epoxyqueuosine reductase
MSEDDFRRRFQGSSVLRAKRVGLQRNACVVLGNRGDAAAVPALRRALTKGEPLVRGHAAWALGRIGNAQARRALERAGLVETGPGVLREIAAAQAELRAVADVEGMTGVPRAAEGLP